MNKDLSLDPSRAALIATPLAVLLLLLVVAPHSLIWNENPLRELFLSLGGWLFAVALIAGILAHEVLHAATWALAGRLPWKSIRFGMNWRVLMPYAHLTSPIRAGAYLAGAAAPGVILGVVPGVYGLTCGDGAAAGWGAIFLAAAAGDFLVIRTLLGLRSDTLVLDHPSRVGCEVAQNPGGSAA